MVDHASVSVLEGSHLIILLKQGEDDRSDLVGQGKLLKDLPPVVLVLLVLEGAGGRGKRGGMKMVMMMMSVDSTSAVAATRGVTATLLRGRSHTAPGHAAHERDADDRARKLSHLKGTA